MSDPLISIPLEDLRAVLPFMARGDVRYYLNGVLVEPYNGGCILVATNGHVAAIIESKAARCDQVRILALSTDEFRAAIRGRIPSYRYPIDADDEDPDDLPSDVHSENFAGTLEVADAESHAIVRTSLGNEAYVLPGKPFLEGKFPDWRKIVPPVASLKPGVPSALAGRYLALMNHPVLVSDQRHQQVLFYGDERKAGNAVTVRFEGIPNLVVLVMPMKTDKPADQMAWPDWMLPSAEGAAALPQR
jgi:hypothetical protein